ncbi:MAG: hypothetical protein WC380_01555 [Pedobacter sp.]|jgi:hypothetical protein
MLILLIAILSLILQFFLPWWIIAPIAFIVSAWKSYSGWNAFRTSFIAIFILWIAMGLIHSLPNNHILANRVGAMLNLPESPINWIYILLITGIVGGLSAGFSGLAGFYFREGIKRK